MNTRARLLFGAIAVLTAASAAVAAAGASMIGHSAAMTFSSRPVVMVGANKSNNWSGYNQGSLEQGGKQFHQVSGTWVVPTATQHKAGEAEYSASWVGIGGGCVDASCMATDATLIQAGTSQDVDAAGTASYSAWWEIIPEPSTLVTLPVKSGDTVSVDIAETTPEVWSIVIRNLTTGGSWSTTTPYTSSYASAEWIEETPVVLDNNGNLTIGPMPTLSRVSFDPGTANGVSPGLRSSEMIQLIEANGAPLATPSNPDPDADGFNDCTYASSCPAPTTS